MAQIPGIFNAAQYFGNSSPKKGHQDSFWDQQSNSVNHSSGPVGFQYPFEGNSTAAVDPFMTSVQNEFDGWDEWPTELEDDFFGNDSSHQNHVGSSPFYNPGSTPDNNTGYNNSQLVVPEHNQDQEDLSESSNSSSVESSPRGMDPELNNAWVEEETTPYAFSKYPPAMLPSGQTPQGAALQSSGADFFDQYLNGETNTQQPDMGEESSTSNGRTYASVCQAGLPVAPPQDYPQNQDYFQEQVAPPTSEAVGAPEMLDPQDNELGADTWSQEPELGSWSPVFNHEDSSLASNQQCALESTVPQIDESTWTNASTFESGVGFGATAQQEMPPSSTFEAGPEIESNPLPEVPPSSAFEPGKVPELPPASSSQVQSFDDGSILAQMYSGDDDSSAPLFSHDTNSFVNNQEGVSEPSIPQTDESAWAVNSPPSRFSSGLGFKATTQQEVPAPLSQTQLFADSAKREMENSNPQLLPHDVETHSSFHSETAVASSQPELFAGNEGHYGEVTNSAPRMYRPEDIPPLLGGDAVSEETTVDASSVQAEPFVMESRQKDSFPEEAPVPHLNVFDNVQPQASVKGMTELLGNLQPGAFPSSQAKDNILLPRSDLETPQQQQSEGFLFSMAPPVVSPALWQTSVQQDEQLQNIAENVSADYNAHIKLPPDEKGFLSSMAPPDVSPALWQTSVQQDEQLQNIPENVPADYNAHIKLPSDEKLLVDSLDHKSSMDSPSGTFKPNSIVEPMQPPSLGQAPLEQTPSGLFMPGSVSEQMKPCMPPDMESSFSDVGRPTHQKSRPEVASEPSGEQRSLVDEPDSPRDAIQAAFLQKQLAGKAPASSPRTSLWMNSAPPTAPCVLAPAAVAAVEPPEPLKSDELQNTDQAPPVTPTLSPSMFAAGEPSEMRKNDQISLPALPTAPSGLAPGAIVAGESSELHKNNPHFPAASLSGPFGLAPGAVAEVQPSELYKNHEASPAALGKNDPAPPAAPSLLTPAVFATAESSDLHKNDQGPPAAPRKNDHAPPAAPPVLVPSDFAAAESSNLPKNDQTTAPPTAPSVLARAAAAAVEPSKLREDNPAPSTDHEEAIPLVPGVPIRQEQRIESPRAPPKTAPVQMSLASLLQGGKGRPKKKTSEAPVSSSKTDVGSLQGASVPPQDTPPFVPQPDIPLSNSAQESSYNSDQQMDNQSFDSVDRTGQPGYQAPYESDYNNPYSRENVRSRDDPYYDHNRRDPYYEQDRRNPYYEQDRREYDRRDYDRREYDRRDYDRRDYDGRDKGEFDRRESDYGRRDYDSREYDRRDASRKDYDRRDSYDRRDPYYGYGSPRQGRRDYNDRRTSREDLYRGHDQGYAHSYHSGRSTPSSDRNSPAYDYPSSSYAQNQYGYPASYADSQNMYQYLTMLYYYYPQHYEQYCAQQGYYNMGYTPEQLAQFYGGMSYPPGYDGSQAEQAVEAEVQESEPARLTPPLYRVQHPLVRFSSGRLISLISSEDEEEQPKCVIASVQMVFSVEEIEIIKAFPGPLSSMYSSRTEVISYCEQRSAVTDLSADGLVKSVIWKILANLVKHNGAFVPSDLAELIMENWRSCNISDQNEFLSAESGQLSPENEKSKHLSIFREMLLAGATKDALEYTMRYGLWGHAMVLASKMDKKVQNEVTNRFMKTMTDFDPIRTVYDHLSGRQPVALMTPDDWQRNLAAMVANPPRQHPQSNKRNMICLGDTLMANDQVWAAHLCYTLAGERFGYPSDEKTKMALIGIDHRKKTISGQNIPLENLQMMEVLEYAVSLNNEDHHIPVLQTYKYLHANKLAEAGFTDEALHYADLIGRVLIKHPHHLNMCLAKNVKELTDRLNPDAQDAAAAEMTEMLDRLLQAKDSSQISSSVTESEGEVEDPLAESSASFFSGYDPVNTPKHHVEKTEDLHHRDSWSEPALSGPADSMGDLGQDSQSGGLNSQDTQPDLPPDQQLPPVEQLPPSTGMQPSAPWTEPPPAVDSPPQPAFFVPGPPVTQQMENGQMENGQPAAVEEQPFYNQQPSWNDGQPPSWNDIQQPSWNDSQQLSWSEGVGREEPKKVEPPPPKEPEPPAKEEPKPKPTEKAKKKANNSNQGGWFSGLSGIIQKVIPRGPNEMILPDDSKKSIYWDEDLKKWVNTEEDEQEKAPPPPPPSDMQLGAGMPPPMPPPMPLGHGIPPNGGAAVKGVGGRAAASPFGAPHMPHVPGSPGSPPGMPTSPVASKFSRKAHGGRRHAKKYVDVLNPSGQSSNAMLPSSLLPMMPGNEFKGNFFVPSPVTTDTSEERTNPQTLDQPPVIGNPSSRPSSRNEEEDGGDQQSQHSRSSSASLTSAEVRSYMMPQDPDPPTQDVHVAPPPMFNPNAFSKAQASPRKSRYPGIRNN